MELKYVNDRLKSKITETHLYQLEILHNLLGLDTDDFCKMIDAVGVEKLLAKEERYNMLYHAKAEMKLKLRYLEAKERLREMEKERADLQAFVDEYKEMMIDDM